MPKFTPTILTEFSHRGSGGDDTFYRAISQPKGKFIVEEANGHKAYRSGAGELVWRQKWLMKDPVAMGMVKALIDLEKNGPTKHKDPIVLVTFKVGKIPYRLIRYKYSPGYELEKQTDKDALGNIQWMRGLNASGGVESTLCTIMVNIVNK